MWHSSWPWHKCCCQYQGFWLTSTISCVKSVVFKHIRPSASGFNGFWGCRLRTLWRINIVNLQTPWGQKVYSCLRNYKNFVADIAKRKLCFVGIMPFFLSYQTAILATTQNFINGFFSVYLLNCSWGVSLKYFSNDSDTDIFSSIFVIGNLSVWQYICNLMLHWLSKW